MTQSFPSRRHQHASSPGAVKRWRPTCLISGAEFIIDLNNAGPDSESLKIRPMKAASLSLVAVLDTELFPVRAQTVLTARHKPARAHSLQLRRPSAVVENSVDGDIIIPRPLGNITEKMGNVDRRVTSQHHGTLMLSSLTSSTEAKVRVPPRLISQQGGAPPCGAAVASVWRACGRVRQVGGHWHANGTRSTPVKKPTS
ncbi:hypothetical protein EYF80_015286 [Liparis tanakae]|uniref:Uncharacterized protein n=1 Tax=Liparis tanakae TaxID=230148 RepID=A0A4Z2I904_9TELE|nr:hypothetical protein EYF80_015286 [Liparis tanakae]